MLRFIVKRLFYGLLVLFGVSTIIFFLFTILPGDPARMLMGQRADIASVEAIKKDLGLDQPVLIQYVNFLNDISLVSVYNTNDFQSYWYLNPNKYGKTISQEVLSGPEGSNCNYLRSISKDFITCGFSNISGIDNRHIAWNSGSAF